jgi:FSR family fosmidomycin resistance protein-like MFS transporter
LLAVGHACVDIYQGAVAALVPFFVTERAYTYAAVAGIVLAASLLSSVAQPLFGALTDRWAMPWLLPVSTLLGGVGIALSGVSGSYGLTLLFVAVSGIGVAAYHPESARLARMASEGSHTSMAWFSTGGNIGFALAPVMAGATVGIASLAWTPLLVLPALVGVSLTLPVLRALAHRQRSQTRGSSTPVVPDDVRSFVKLAVAVVFRSIAFVGLSTFIDGTSTPPSLTAPSAASAGRSLSPGFRAMSCTSPASSATTTTLPTMCGAQWTRRCPT